MRQALKSRIASNKEVLIGSWLTIPHPAIAEIFARSGYDFLVHDLEHSGMTLAQAEEMIRVCDLTGVPSLVRLSGHDWIQAKRVMDMGATGIIVPMVNSMEQAKSAVASVYYPPRGSRGVGLSRAQGYGVSFNEYHQRTGQETVVIAQIEHIEAVHNMESIMETPGIDGYIVGPYDLSASMGLAGQFEHSAVIDALATIKEKALKSGKPGGLHLVEPEEVKLESLLSDGHRLLAYGVDFRMLDTSARRGVECVKKFKQRGNQ